VGAISIGQLVSLTRCLYGDNDDGEDDTND
jgi:hypothetical protein